MFRPIKLRHYLAVMQRKGYAAESVLAGSGLESAALAQTECLVELTQIQKVVSNIILLTGDQSLGFEMGESARLTDLGIVGHALISARTMRDAVCLWIKFSNALLGELTLASLQEESPDHWSVTISEIEPTGFLFNFCVEELLMTTLRIGGALADAAMTPILVELSYPAPSHSILYTQNFGQRIEFNRPRTRAVFCSPCLDRERPGNDEEFNEICLKQCEQMFYRLKTLSPVAMRLRSLLFRSPGRILSQEDAASTIGMTDRTLRRHLAKEGTTYKALVSDLRLNLAAEYLRNPYMPLAAKEVAYMVGFQSTDAFRRAFKAWAGMTVGDYCARNRAEF